MKTILFMRHAKSDWGAQYRTDFERPLNKRGQRDAPMMAAFLAQHHLMPDLIVSSPAMRARLTAEYIARTDTFQGELAFDKRIYLASPGMLLTVIRELPEYPDTVMLVGHNPGMEDIIELLGGGRVRMPTAAIASMRLYADAWADVEEDGAHLQWLIKPKILR
ncbi:MAG TPA: histidine phosphatase family protein [Anaerolineae bacterium]|nr:histidine phosphatase family protein [Anaerolineae bacterium]